MDRINVCLGDNDATVPSLVSFKPLFIDTIEITFSDAPKDNSFDLKFFESTDVSKLDDNLQSTDENSAGPVGDSGQYSVLEFPNASASEEERKLMNFSYGHGDNIQLSASQFCNQGNEKIPYFMEDEDDTVAITYGKALENLCKEEILWNYSSFISSESQKDVSILRTLINYIFGHTKLSESLQDEKDYVLCLSKISFDNSSKLHFLILKEIFKTLLKSPTCPRFGEHWEIVGFQGNDPASDLRSGGILSLLQILYMISDEKFGLIAKDIFQLSRDNIQEFPFCSVGINLTVICLKVLRSGVLNKEFNEQKEILGLLNEFYCSLFYEFYSQWKLKKKKIIECSLTLDCIEKKALKRPCRLMRDYKKLLRKQSS